ncbi:hypothetical protein NL676_034983 [Syzygium grande]|nr:hypothetical protein NL676_034983 [Syzygium grande]
MDQQPPTSDQTSTGETTPASNQTSTKEINPQTSRTQHPTLDPQTVFHSTNPAYLLATLSGSDKYGAAHTGLAHRGLANRGPAFPMDIESMVPWAEPKCIIALGELRKCPAQQRLTSRKRSGPN